MKTVDMKKLYPVHDAMQVLGGICKNPEILKDKKYQLNTDTFLSNFHKIVFASIHNLIKNEIKVITNVAIEEYLKTFNQSWLETFKTYDKDCNYIETVLEITEIENFDYHYNRLKKFELLRDLHTVMGFDTSILYDTTETNPQLNLKFEGMSEEDILDYVSLSHNNLKTKWVSNDTEKGYTVLAHTNIDNVIANLKETPAYGHPFINPVFTTIFRGMREKRVKLFGATSGLGKSRIAIATSIKTSVPFVYDPKLKKWVSNGKAIPSLYITTELEVAEVQTIILAAISSIEEHKILDYDLTEEEEDRLNKAVWILKNSPLYISYISDYCAFDIENLIEKYVLQYNIAYVQFDYLHITPSLLREMSENSKLAREDLVILLFITKLKEIANKYSIYIGIGSQLNRGSKDNENQIGAHSFRGSFAALDKVDIGVIAVTVTAKDLELLKDILETNKESSFKNVSYPNTCYVVVKNRGNRMKNVRVWSKMDLSTMREEIILVTDLDYNPIEINLVNIQLEDEENSEYILSRLNRLA